MTLFLIRVVVFISFAVFIQNTHGLHGTNLTKQQVKNRQFAQKCRKTLKVPHLNCSMDAKRLSDSDCNHHTVITAHITCMKLLVFYVFYGQTYILTAIIHIQIIFIYCFGVIRWPTYGWHGMHVQANVLYLLYMYCIRAASSTSNTINRQKRDEIVRFIL